VSLEELTAEVLDNVLSHMGGDRDRVLSRLLHLDPDRAAPELARLRDKLQISPRPRKR
jgi:hypothetical protein